MSIGFTPSVTISRDEYEGLQKGREYRDRKIAELTQRNRELEMIVATVRDLVAPAEDESETGSEPEPTLTTTTDGMSFGSWYYSAGATCPVPTVRTILYNPGGSH